jgi:two-component system cell cycle sensor histidine kinase/response regulator CckA
MEFMTNIYDISLTLTAVLLLVALGWSTSLRRRVREQSEQIRNQLRREASLEAKYRDLFEQANDMVFSHELSGKLTSLNKAGERILGCAREQALRMSLREFVAPAQIESFDQWLSRCLAGITPPPFEVEIVGRNEVHSVLDVSVRLLREGGQIVAVEGIARDITEKKRAEQALRQSEERFSSAFRVSPVAIGICNLTEWRFIDVNQSFLRLFGFERHEVIDHTAGELKLWPDADDRTRIENMFRGEQSVCGAECQFRVKSGGLRTTLLFAERINLGNVPCALTIVYDITDRLNLEAQLRQALKMEAVGRLAAGVAHDFNNLLTIIQCSTDLIIQQTNHHPKTTIALQRISEATHRATSLTRQLLTFSRQQNLQREPLALNEVINNGSRMFKHLLRDDLNLRFRFSPNLPIVNADPTMIDQVIMNLVVNARDAMPNGGDLLLETAPVEIGPAYLQNHPEAVAGSFVCLIFSDTGCGMDAATQSRIFEPFFTTKEAGKGTGLGLATVYGIVKQHEGWIEVLSEVGRGSTFKIFIPADKHPDSLAKQNPPAQASDGKRSILVVEGESAVAELIQQVLEAEGYRLLQASNALVALQVWNDHEGQIDLLLTDVKMPSGMSGVDIAQNLRALKPDLKILYVTGYSPDTINPEAFVGPNTLVLPKPFSRTELVKAVRLSLEPPQQPVA